MRPITDAIGQDLVWIERGRPGWPNSHVLGAEHELRLGDEVVARLRFQMGWPSEAEVDGRHWTFERMQPHVQEPKRPAVLAHIVKYWREISFGGEREISFGGEMAVRDEEFRDVAYLRRSGLLELRDGTQLRLERRSLLFVRTEWAWMSDTQIWVHFEERVHKVWRFKSGLVFAVLPTVAKLSEMPLLVLIGWYRILLRWEADRYAPGGVTRPLASGAHDAYTTVRGLCVIPMPLSQAPGRCPMGF